MARGQHEMAQRDLVSDSYQPFEEARRAVGSMPHVSEHGRLVPLGHGRRGRVVRVQTRLGPFPDGYPVRNISVERAE